VTDADRTSRFFDAYAADFSSIYGGSGGFTGRIISKVFRRSMMLRYLRTIEGCRPIEGRSVLDVGCGPGHYSIALAGRGARRVVGIDFAPAMIDLARSRAEAAGVGGICEFVCADFMTRPLAAEFDYSVVMGFMDYARDPASVVARVLSLTASRAFFSFPAAGGLLAWQRAIRYRRRCDLFLYRRQDLEHLLERTGRSRVEIDRIARDFFVTVRKGE
jgi:SAM-dependent methyltransferase